MCIYMYIYIYVYICIYIDVYNAHPSFSPNVFLRNVPVTLLVINRVYYKLITSIPVQLLASNKIY